MSWPTSNKVLLGTVGDDDGRHFQVFQREFVDSEDLKAILAWLPGAVLPMHFWQGDRGVLVPGMPRGLTLVAEAEDKAVTSGAEVESFGLRNLGTSFAQLEPGGFYSPYLAPTPFSRGVWRFSVLGPFAELFGTKISGVPVPEEEAPRVVREALVGSQTVIARADPGTLARLAVDPLQEGLKAWRTEWTARQAQRGGGRG